MNDIIKGKYYMNYTIATITYNSVKWGMTHTCTCTHDHSEKLICSAHAALVISISLSMSMSHIRLNFEAASRGVTEKALVIGQAPTIVIIGHWVCWNRETWIKLLPLIIPLQEIEIRFPRNHSPHQMRSYNDIIQCRRVILSRNGKRGRDNIPSQWAKINPTCGHLVNWTIAPSMCPHKHMLHS